MAYYDLYDGNDNLVASDVWIDDGSNSAPSRPIVINWYKLIMIIFLVVGFVSTFITPINLFINKDKFVNNGWIYMCIFNILIGFPTFLAFFKMLKLIKSAPNTDDPCYEIACEWTRKHCNINTENKNILETDEDALSDEEYISKEKNTNKFNATAAGVYILIKYQKLLDFISKISYMIYPLAILSLLMELFVKQKTIFFILLFNLNFIALICCVLSVYKGFKMYQKNKATTKRLIKTCLLSYVFSVPLMAIIFSLANIDGYYIFVFLVAIMDLAILIDNLLLRKGVINLVDNKKKEKIHIGAIIIIRISMSLLMLIVACAISLLPGPIYDALISYDQGISTDLSLPIAFWGLCVFIDVLSIVLLSILTNKKLNKKAKE